MDPNPRQLKCLNQFKPAAQNDINIEQNSKSIIYKYNHEPLKPIEYKYNHEPLKPIEPKNIDSPNRIVPSFQELSKMALSPNICAAKVNLAKYRCKQNIMYQFDNYIVYDKLLGEGSFSKVYLGEAKKTKKLLAIKQVGRLEQNEIACLMDSSSPYIIKLYSFWNVNKRNYIALELCDANLREKLSFMTQEQKILYFEQIVEGMNYLNKKKILHRDLKFENILLKNNTIKISDFGLAKPIGSQLSVLSQKCGTPYTMAPEIYFHHGQGKPIYSHKCDIYSLGVILHELLYGTHPFDYSVEKMRVNSRVLVDKKFGILDVLIDRSLEQEPVRRCNWNEFLQIFNLYKSKKNQQNLEILKLKNFMISQFKAKQHNHKKSTNNLQKYHRYKTPLKNQKKIKYPYQNEKENPFKQINIPIKQDQQKKIQSKIINWQYHKQQSQDNLIQKKIRQQNDHSQHNQFFYHDEKNSTENQTILAVKLIFLVVMVISFIALINMQFK